MDKNKVALRVLDEIKNIELAKPIGEYNERLFVAVSTVIEYLEKQSVAV